MINASVTFTSKHIRTILTWTLSVGMVNIPRVKFLSRYNKHGHMVNKPHIIKYKFSSFFTDHFNVG